MEKCKKHPKYKGIKQPKYECEDCFVLYFIFGLRSRAPIIQTKIVLDKTKYNRKRLEEDDGDE